LVSNPGRVGLLGSGTINGVAMTNRSSRCVIDNRWASGSSTSTSIQGAPFTGGQFDPPNGALVWKYGVASGWTYGYADNYTTITSTSCTVSILRYTGGTMSTNSTGGDSGGPYITEVWDSGGYHFYAHGTHRGRSGSLINSVPISAINGQGWSVG
jgi:hypothetical protein